jgi:hypothetical protein
MSDAVREDSGGSMGAGELLWLVLLLIIHFFMALAIFAETSAFFSGW